MATERQLMEDANKLLKQYLALTKEKYGKAPSVNFYKERYAMKSVIESVGYERASEIMSYYFKTARHSYPLDWFKYNFDTLDKIMVELALDEKKKQKVREETRKRVEEWERRKRESRGQTD